MEEEVKRSNESRHLLKRSSESRHLLFRCHPEGNPGTAIADRFAGVHPKALP